MKDRPLIVIERHPARTVPPERTIRQIVVAWLTKELRK